MRIEDLRVRDVLDADVLLSVPAHGLHDALAISPVSSSCFSVRRSACTSCPASRPKSLATAAPSLPPGGSYRSRTLTCVPRPPVEGVKWTEPALSTSAPSTERQPIMLFG